MSSQKGFTLFEILIVVAVLAILFTIAIPNMVEAKKNGNEGQAATALRHIVQSQAMFRERDREGDHIVDYATSLDELAATGILNDTLASGRKSGYAFQLIDVTEFTFSAVANPLEPGRTGDRYFFVDQTGVVRYSSTGQATAADSPYGD